MTSIHDVARRAEVSVGTVSRVLNEHPAVSPRTRRAVQKAIAELDYRPNAVARNLRQSRTGAVGVVIDGLNIAPFTAIVHGIERALATRGISLFLCDTSGSPSAQSAHLERLYDQRVDGVIIHPIGAFHEPVAALRRKGVPVVVIGQRAPSGAGPEVVIDEDEASLAAVRLLLRLGHRRIAFLSRGPSGRNLSHSSPQARRVACYRAASTEFGVPVDESLIALAPEPEDAALTAAALLSRPDRPTAILAGVHAFAPEILWAARRVGLRVPADLSLVTYGDSRWAEVYDPPVAVIRNDYDVYGRSAADLLFRAMAGEGEGITVHQPAEFVARATCAPHVTRTED